MKKISEIIKNPITITLAIILILVIGTFYLVKNLPSEDIPSAAYSEKYWGIQDAKVTLIEYADFNCPGCKSFTDTNEKPLKEKYATKIKFVYKHLPLQIPGHETSQRAAEASEAANAQGKFWEYHDLLFSRQSDGKNWSIDKLTSYAEELKLDTAKFKKELNESYYRKTVKDSIKEANDKGVSGTPSFFLNGEKLTSSGGDGTIPSLEDIEKAIDKALK